MPAIHARKSTVLAAAIITGAAGAAFGQQLAATDLDAERHAYIVTHCGPIDRASLQCVAGKSIEFDRAQIALERKATAEAGKRIAEHQKAIAEHQKAIADYQKAGEASRTRAQCLSAISDAILGKRITPADVRSAKTTPTQTDDPCVWRERLAPRLGALTKQ